MTRSFLVEFALVAWILAGGALAHGADHAAPDPAGNAAADVRRFLDHRVGTVPLSEATGELREFTLEIHKIEGEIAPGVRVEQWAYSLAGHTPTVPGPELRVKQGDRVRLTFKNTHDQPHTIHSHGIASLAQDMDGVPHTSRDLKPGESFTYEFVATDAGTFAYHCHVQTYLHADMGMYGALIVEPRDPAERVWDREYTLILDEWDSRQSSAAPLHDPKPNYFLVNGKAYPDVPPLVIPEGQVALVRFINLGYQPHSMHLHGNSFLIVRKDSYPLGRPQQADTLLIGPGERYDVLIKGRDGTFPFHDHALQNNTSAGLYPGGMHFMVQGGPPRTAHGTPAPSVTGAPHHGDHAAADVPLSAQPDVTVDIRDFAFAPEVIRVKRGTTVTWSNADFVQHAVTAGVPGGAPPVRVFGRAGEAIGGYLARGGRWRFTFDVPGTYTYYCTPHPFMRGTVIVED